MANMSKIVLVGTGMVGATFAYRLVATGIASELVLIDVDRNRAEGEMMDLNHALPFERTCRISVGDYSAAKDAGLVVITAGAAQKPGETRLDLVGRNVAIFRQIIPEIVKYAPDCMFLIASNPVDIMTYIVLKLSGFPRNRVIGSGTVLDTSRFRYMLGDYYKVDSRSVHAYILGEHGDSEVPVWSTANIAGVSLEDYSHLLDKPYSQQDMDNIFEEVRTAAYKIIERKKATYYAIGSGLVRLVESILRDQDTVYSVSSLLTGQYGIEDICLSLPAVLGRDGVGRIIEIPLDEKEVEGLRRSATVLKDLASKVL
ncbi:MAG TPA: L-lactate dehydrogenase [Chloroflexia bacterium]|nr:L-lactate dehydrogenase [Chloroflexia bacterium]